MRIDMRSYVSHLTFVTAIFLTIQAGAQDATLRAQLEQSHYLRYVMKADTNNAGMNRWLKKKVERSRSLPLASDINSLRTKGPATIRVDRSRSVSGQGSILLETPSSLGVKNPTNRSYSSAELIRPLKGEDLREFNRFSVWVYADAPGFYSIFVGCTLYNGGKHVMPVPGRFEGQHFVSVIPNQWQHIVWEMPDLYRDSVTGFSVNVMLSGSPKGAAEYMNLNVDDMRIEKVDAENSRGFNLRKGSVAYCHSGYRVDARKEAVVQNTRDSKFQLLDDHRKVALAGDVRSMDNGFAVADFSTFRKPGRYTLKVGDVETQPFPIGDEAYLATAWRTLNFFFGERCGYDQPGIHQACHLDVITQHPDGRKLNVAGGWHDAADLTQGVGNTARGGIAMLELARSVKKKQPILYERLLEEARWGLNWTMQTKFGDGYRQGGLIIGIWSDNIIGTKDDMLGKATNSSGDNFIASQYCALAAPFYQDTDPVFANWCRQSAIEDFDFASQLLGMSVTAKNETTLNAQALVAAVNLFRMTRASSYLDKAAKYARAVMDAQQQERRTEWTIPLHGFFYESREKKRILEFFHRSDEHLMVEGLAMLLADAPTHPDARLWKASCVAYADYLHDMAGVIKPYGILPSAIYELNNADFAGIYHEGERVGLPSMEEYNAQVKNGIPLGGNFFLRRFPVSYQFRGFHAVLLGKAKAAFILADVLKDKSLQEIGTRQLEYIVGYNPFAMSTIYGDGYDYPPLYGGYAGDLVGSLPVGIETFENDDEPYMPMQVNATYKEIWTHTTASMIWALSKVFEE